MLCQVNDLIDCLLHDAINICAHPYGNYAARSSLAVCPSVLPALSTTVRAGASAFGTAQGDKVSQVPRMSQLLTRAEPRLCRIY